MSYRHTLEAALESLQDIEELIKGFPESGDVPSIELDLSLQKLRNIYELLLVLKKPVDLSMDQPPAAVVAPSQAPVSTPSYTPASPIINAPVSTQVSAPVSVPPLAPPPPSETVPPPPPVQAREPVVKTGDTQILSDRFKSRTTLHETLHQSLGSEGQFHAQGKPVENLMSAIAINDRFTFIRELFNGDSPSFEHAIRVLNESANFNDAYNYMIQNYDWDMDSDAVQLLLDIIRRKYIISRHE
jgi:hypothetical protein